MENKKETQEILNKKELCLLFSWNPKKSGWTVEKYKEACLKVKNGEKYLIRDWKCIRKNEVEKETEVFIVKIGDEEPKGIIGHGYIKTLPTKKYDEKKWRVDIEIDKLLDYENEELLKQEELTDKFPKQKWNPEGSGIEIKEKVLPELRKMWNKLINGEEISKTSDGGDEETMKKEFDKNVIFYGPPGTGKTYTTAKKAVAICDNVVEEDLTNYTEVMKRYNKLKENNRIEFITFHQSYGYEEFIEGIKPIVLNEDDESEDESENNKESKTNIKIENDIKYDVVDGIFKKFCDNARKAIIETNNNDIPLEAYVFIIDEINRGNISKIFGELITLIETTKRAGKEECISTKLPYSKEEFTVPDNVYIIGTMNTADRSIALMDTALRRRFYFEEMLPNYDLLKDIFVEDEGVKVNIGAMLKVINERIEYLYDREHTIGHAVFLELKENNNIDKLENIFKKSVIPLLQEYFYEDYDKIRLILGDNAKDEDEQFIFAESIKPKDVFEGDIGDIDIPEKKYIIKYENFRNIMAYKNISQKKDLSKKISDE
ncbi:AAA family ATPase [Fusobacterium pseudoperiodonticum]|jgi:GTPase subunit of restriction endonuclease|uniref:McrB family protein n=1 Tax=Fusobacterium pseudoperiodonticum TaxID=2663009 RepID=UPI0028E24B3D|nr:AAA family ATPase [Fusobacterium pseudoperiodonticum]